MGIRDLSTGFFNNLKKAKNYTSNHDGLSFSSITTLGAATLGGVFGGAEGAMAAAGAMIASNAGIVALDSAHNAAKRIAERRIKNHLNIDVNRTLLSGSEEARPAYLAALGTNESKLDPLYRTSYLAGEVLNDNIQMAKQYMVDPTISMLKKGVHKNFNFTSSEKLGATLSGMGTGAATTFGMTFGASGSPILASAASGIYAAGMAGAPLINNMLKGESSIIKRSGVLKPVQIKEKARTVMDATSLMSGYIKGGNEGLVDKMKNIGTQERLNRVKGLADGILEVYKN